MPRLAKDWQASVTSAEVWFMIACLHCNPTLGTISRWPIEL
jgi:hypothetical protein